MSQYIVNGVPWFDQNNNPVNAHGAGIVYVRLYVMRLQVLMFIKGRYSIRENQSESGIWGQMV